MKYLFFLLLTVSIESNAQLVNSLHLFSDINAYRVSKGLPALKYDSTLQAGTDEWAKQISSTYEHSGEEVEVYENLAWSLTTDNFLELWVGSPSHHAVLLEMNNAAVAIYKGSDGYYAVIRGTL
jgi:uncharacterized protein YkwD